MTQNNRLSSGGRIDRSQPLTFTFNGKQYQGFKGDTVASALLANGVDIVGRSFKYSRPRGVIAAGAEEPNAILQMGATEATQVPNVRATQQELFDGLVCQVTNGWPSAEFDVMGLVGKAGGSFMPPGFYYKTFMYPQSMWDTYEKCIRKAAGLGRSPRENDPDIYDHINQHVDVMIVGGGAAGLAAALSASRSGARVILADEQAELGGSLLHASESIDGRPASEWAAEVIAQLEACDNVQLLPRSTVNGYHDHNFLTIHQRCTDHLLDCAPIGQARQRMHRVRAKWVVLATGAHERPLVFANNDVPGCMLASAVTTYIKRYSVVPGERLVLMTTNDSAYQAAFDWAESGRFVVAIVDTRAHPGGDVIDEANRRGLKVIAGSAVIEVKGSKRVTGVSVSAINQLGDKALGPVKHLTCDTVASSGGWSPAVHLSCHTGSRPVWRDDVIGFVPGNSQQKQLTAGAINGTAALSTCLQEGFQAGREAAINAGFDTVPSISLPKVDERHIGAAMALFHIPHSKPTSRAPKQFVDFQTDVTAAGIEIATREGYESIEHVKRYTAMGFGTDQGKLGNINGMAIAAKSMNKTIPETGTTIFRPNYTPVTFGAVAGRHCGELFDPKRYSAMHSWHLKNGALFEDVGLWKRPWYFPQAGESMQESLNRECKAAREGVAILDASTLGKIDIQGKDAREFLGRIYTNAWAKLAIGKCRYGLMCGEDGMVFDDGVTACLADDHFVMTTTTGGAARVLEWLELYHQTEWPEMEVYFNTVTDQWSTMTISGPNSRKLLSELTGDIDLSRDAFKFMDWHEGTVAGVPARVFRISFTGELSFEVNVPANYGLYVWEKVFEHGAKYNLTPYGTETMHILRAEKGFIIAGQDTDGSVTPIDLGMDWCVSNQKPYSYIGKRGMNREDCLRKNRKQLVGLKTKRSDVVIPEGSQAVADPNEPVPMTMLGHITSSYYSACLGRSIAMGMIRDGFERMGQTVYYPQPDGSVIEAEICSPIFLDPKGERQNV
ncbi:sarcosine oxidase subunit alpha [Dasania sp. GY-MA-18]|uniref:Sarcosine oxidase subunit alpha n=1 Tax=Dasania phycosphaerae TaxID=2950436 RepID=A0A9J6RPI8_9GAMM|nr:MULTISPECIES: sarcosine oxidase subunit alpha [Dasania]MCR8923507.1 sarcosine oxidase subunit alpha [Dasania sp. GY-MA-18]MCZ0865941.1 sarcosine oxidase subunit alpha [Dasania phycosphaerae]MCZ0869665.1 sarcosine oxidase subunit alpha [Dasania phycosphaerae]